MRRIIVIVLLLCGMGTAQAEGGLEIYFVRHAETIKNATGIHNSGNGNDFSDKGNEQVTQLTDQLKTLHFNAILVSPAPRALNTILPYLKESGQTGQIWPEFTECCWQSERNDIADGQLVTDSAIQLNQAQEPFFTFRDENARYNYANHNYADGVAQVRHGEALFAQRYLNSGKTILIVGHYHAGKILLADLLNISPDQLPNLKNAKITHLHQDEDGHFSLVTLNDKTVSH